MEKIPTGLDLYVIMGLDDYTIKDILNFKDWKRAYRIMMESTILFYKSKELKSEEEAKKDAKEMFKPIDLKMITDWIDKKKDLQ